MVDVRLEDFSFVVHSFFEVESSWFTGSGEGERDQKCFRSVVVEDDGKPLKIPAPLRMDG